MTDILIFRARQPDAMRTLIGRAATSRIRALNIDTDVLLDDWLPRLEFVQHRDVLNRQALDQVGLDSLALAQNWYQVGGSDPTMLDGLSFGQYIDCEIKRVFTVICRHIAFLDALRPTRILLADDGSLICQATKSFAAAYGVPVVSVPADPIPQPTDWLLPQFTATTGLRHKLKWLLCEISQLLGRLGSSKPLTLLVQPYSYTRTLIQAILIQSPHRLVLPYFVRDYLGHRRVMLTDWRLAPVPADGDSLRANTWRALEAEMTRCEALSYRGVALWPVVRDVIRAFWNDAWDGFVRQVRYFSRLFDRVHLDAVIVVQDQSGPEKLVVMLARQRGVRSFYVAHGIVGCKGLGFPGINADTLAVFGDECGNIWQQFIPGGRIVALGNDDLGQLERRVSACDRESLRRRIGLTEQAGIVILFAAQPYGNWWSNDEPADQNRILQSMCRAGAQLREAAIVIRLHPSTGAYESVEVKHTIIRHYNHGNLLLDPGFALEEALAISDVVVTTESTVGAKAIAARRALVVFDPLNFDAAGYARGEAGAVAHAEEELLSVLQRLVTDVSFRDEIRARGQKFLTRRVVGFGDGQAGARLLAEIERTCKTGTRSLALA